jgi:hypothetical protein
MIHSTRGPGRALPRAALFSFLAGAVAPALAQPAGLVGRIEGRTGGEYVVAPGDTLWEVARAHGLPLERLRELNPGLRGDLILPGQRLKVAVADPGSVAPPSSTTPAPAAPVRPPGPPDWRYVDATIASALGQEGAGDVAGALASLGAALDEGNQASAKGHYFLARFHDRLARGAASPGDAERHRREALEHLRQARDLGAGSWSLEEGRWGDEARKRLSERGDTSPARPRPPQLEPLGAADENELRAADRGINAALAAERDGRLALAAEEIADGLAGAGWRSAKTHYFAARIHDRLDADANGPLQAERHRAAAAAHLALARQLGAGSQLESERRWGREAEARLGERAVHTPLTRTVLEEGRALRQGDRGPEVEELQRRLGVDVDGQFGGETATAVRALQARHHLEPDAVVGVRTLRRLTTQGADAARGEPGSVALSTSEAWRNGARLGRIRVRVIDGKPVEERTAAAFLRMRDEAALDGVDIRIVSGFRSWEEQARLYRLFLLRLERGWGAVPPGEGNPANPPGWSNHQDGRALDLNTEGPGVNWWLLENAHRFGFEDTVQGEPWHWERVR